MVAIIDYGVGNLFSLRSSFAAIGEGAEVTSDPETIRRADRVILPGVGAFGDAADKLRETGLDTVVKEEAAGGKPLLGICLGMQMLFEKSFEYGVHEGLGLLKVEIRPIGERIPAGLKIPQDISVLGFDDTFVTSITSPRLTSVGYDYQSFGAALVQTALEPQTGWPLERRVPVFITERESCAAPGRRNL